MLLMKLIGTIINSLLITNDTISKVPLYRVSSIY